MEAFGGGPVVFELSMSFWVVGESRTWEEYEKMMAKMSKKALRGVGLNGGVGLLDVREH